MVTRLHAKRQIFCDVKPMVGMTKVILDGSSQDSGAIMLLVSMIPLCIKVANIKRRGKRK